MQPRKLNEGDVVQIDPEHDSVFGSSFMVVTEVKSWGVQGYVHAFPGFNADGTKHEGGRAYLRVAFEHMEYIVQAEWVWEGEHDKTED